MDFKILSKHRGKIMGLAIISIILFHYLEDVRVFNNASFGLIKIAKIYNIVVGSGGVDIFIMLSAIGLYFSYTKNNNIKEFYIKRIKRVLIPYVVLCGTYWIIFDLIIKRTSLIVFGKDFLWISFFTNHTTTFWYIFGILVLYLIFPFVYKFVNEGKNYKIRILTLIVVNLLLNAIIFVVNRTLYNNIEIFLIRIINYFIGIYIAKNIYENSEINKKFIWILIGIFFIALGGKIVLFFKSRETYYLINRYITIIMSTIVTIIIALIFEKIKMKNIENILEVTGKYTLELYIFHIAYREILNYFKYYTSIFEYQMLMVILTVISSIVFNKIYGYIMNQLKGVDVNEQNLRRRY